MIVSASTLSIWVRSKKTLMYPLYVCELGLYHINYARDIFGFHLILTFQDPMKSI
jgi:hypothetical protein